MLGEHNPRRRLLPRDVETHRDQLIAVPLGEVGDGTGKSSAWPREFVARLRNSVLSDNCAHIRAAAFFECP
jgi:hypothetical protein